MLTWHPSTDPWWWYVPHAIDLFDLRVIEVELHVVLHDPIWCDRVHREVDFRKWMNPFDPYREYFAARAICQIECLTCVGLSDRVYSSCRTSPIVSCFLRERSTRFALCQHPVYQRWSLRFHTEPCHPVWVNPVGCYWLNHYCRPVLERSVYHLSSSRAIYYTET